MGNLLDPTDSQTAYQERDPEDRRKRSRPSLNQRVQEWCRSRSANFRLPFGAWFTFMILMYLFTTENAARFDIVNRMTHGLGHVLWGVFFSEPSAVAGLIVQFGIPALALMWFFRTFDYFGASTTFAWFGTAMLWNVPYIEGAKESVFPAGLKEEVHDWNAIVTGMNAVEDVGAMQTVMWIFGVGALALGVTLACNQLYYMWTLEERRKEEDRRLDEIAKGFR